MGSRVETVVIGLNWVGDNILALPTYKALQHRYRSEGGIAVAAPHNVATLLASTGLFERPEVEVRDVRLMDPAYVIYDHSHRRNVSTIHRFLRRNGVIPAGRFGEWEYLNMDHALLSGRLAADEALGKRAAHGYRTPK